VYLNGEISMRPETASDVPQAGNISSKPVASLSPYKTSWHVRVVTEPASEKQ
jgi:hypothetical protein